MCYPAWFSDALWHGTKSLNGLLLQRRTHLSPPVDTGSTSLYFLESVGKYSKARSDMVVCKNMESRSSSVNW